MKKESIRGSIINGLVWKFAERIGAKGVAFIVSMFSPVTALFIAGLGTLLGCFFVTSAIKGLNNASDNKVPYVAFLSFAVLAVITYALIKLILPVFLSSSLLSIKRGLY